MRRRDSESIEDLVAIALDRLESDGPAALEELYRRHPESADALRVRVEWLLETGLAAPAAPPAAGGRGFPERLGDFRLVEPLGQGGMGVVYRAEQLSLGREVALKLVRPEQLYFPGALQRFEREVATVAALSHPGIVPIYAVGQEDGVPFFAMERVAGISLGAAIARLEGRDPRALSGADLVAAIDALAPGSDEPASTLFEGPWPVVCARVVREVAEALEHAHRRGVLHRDVKPSNVMVTRGGRVMLVDFGLSSQGLEAVDGAERPTRTGQRVGTLAYMAPEQLRGERGLDARIDVYAVGIVLYELLTLRLPHTAATVAERLAAGDRPLPADLRKTDPRVPWELETVAQAAADPDPVRRYGSAAELALDLGNVLASRPIGARRASAWLRGRRWVQRHPALALGGLIVVLGPSLFALQARRSNRALSAQGAELAESNAALGLALADAEAQRDLARREREQADTERARAERHFERANQAVELMLGRVGGEVLSDVPGMEPTRRSLLSDALELQQALLADQRGAEATPLRARTLHRAATLHLELGELDRALELLDLEAVELERLLAGGPTRGLHIQRGELERQRAAILALAGRLAPAEEAARQAVDALAALAVADPARGTAWAEGAARLQLGDVLMRAGRRVEANGELSTAIALLQAAVDEDGGDWSERALLAGALLLRSGSPQAGFVGGDGPYDPRVGEPFLRRALELQRELASERPDDPRGSHAVVRSALALGNSIASQGRMAEAEPYLREAVEQAERLVRSFPARPGYSEALASSCYSLSLVVGASGPGQERRALLERAIEGFRDALEKAPQVERLQQRLALAEAQLGHAFKELGQPDEAEPPLVRALARGRAVLDARGELTPDLYDLRMGLVWATTLLASVRLDQDELAGAVEAARGYLALHPLDVELVHSAYFFAKAIAAGRERELDPEQLVAWEAEALDLIERAAGNAPRDPDVRRELIDPAFAVFAENERYLGALDLLGLDLPR